MRERGAATLPASSKGNEVISANIEFYRQIAQKYDQYEACASDSFFQRSVEDDLALIEKNLPKRADAVHCLDCGGGTGNLTLKMLRRGWRVTVVDVSADMLDILAAKICSAGFSAAFAHEPVESFFARSTESFDLISFSSVLHHLYSPLQAVATAAQKISAHGFFYSVFDPVPPSSPRAAACFTSLDTVLAKLLHDRADLLPGILRRARKFTAPRDINHARPIISAGDLAEYHARAGVDDQMIERVLLDAGFTVDRQRSPVGRTALARLANRHLQLLLNFKILAQRTRPSHESNQP